ncbi:hypothetical protein Tco_1000901 [Tanacetum coccineum]
MENPRDKEFLASTSWADVQNMIRLACAFAPGAYTFHYESGDAIVGSSARFNNVLCSYPSVLNSESKYASLIGNWG